MKPTRVMTICFLLRTVDGKDYVCLPEKKRGLGVGKVNGYGGKLQQGETNEECMIRETKEESTVDVLSSFYHGEMLVDEPARLNICHVFSTADWSGEPSETEEMKPNWFLINKVPFERMWETDSYYLPFVLKGHKIKAFFRYDDKDALVEKTVEHI